VWKANFEDVIPTLKRTEFPVDVLVETTAFCNLKCVMCPQKSMKRPRGEMKFEIFRKIVDEIAFENTSTRLWLAIMGEALLLKEKLIEMIRYAKAKGIGRIHLNTNGTLMFPSMTEKLIESGIDEIIVGIDAFSEETYNKIRVGGNFKEVIDNIEFFLKQKKEKRFQKPKLILQFIVMDENEHELEQFKEYWLAKGAIIKVRPKVGWGTAINADNLNLPDTARTFPCPMLIRACAIHWSGEIAHCSDADFEGEYYAGDVRTQTIKEVWNGELARRREKHWAGDFSHDLCRSCRDWQTGRSLFFYPEMSNEN